VAKIGLALGMEILIHTLQHVDTLPENCLVVNRKALFEQSDIISLHCPLNNKTENIINSTTLKIMKSSAILINTSRGQLIDEAALADALNHDEIAAAGLDVLSQEPAWVGNPLLKAKNCFITPHIAWATKNARQRLLDIAVSNVQAYLNGEVRNCVNL
jgi:glycerate dehydrogenase